MEKGLDNRGQGVSQESHSALQGVQRSVKRNEAIHSGPHPNPGPVEMCNSILFDLLLKCGHLRHEDALRVLMVLETDAGEVE